MQHKGEAPPAFMVSGPYKVEGAALPHPTPLGTAAAFKFDDYRFEVPVYLDGDLNGGGLLKDVYQKGRPLAVAGATLLPFPHGARVLNLYPAWHRRTSHRQLRRMLRREYRIEDAAARAARQLAAGGAGGGDG